MAKAECNAIPRADKILRHYIVGYIPDRYEYPQLCIKGKWLRDAGFAIGGKVHVRVMQGCLVVTAQYPQPGETEIQAGLKAASKLSEKSQSELIQIIQGVMLRDKVLPK